jgi:hypothetical protein
MLFSWVTLAADVVTFRDQAGASHSLSMPKGFESFPGMFGADLILIEKKNETSPATINIVIQPKKINFDFPPNSKELKEFLQGSLMLLKNENMNPQDEGMRGVLSELDGAVHYDFKVMASGRRQLLRKIYWLSPEQKTISVIITLPESRRDMLWKDILASLKSMQKGISK